MMTIDITTILSKDLRSRNRVADLLLFINNTHEQDVVLDFSRVQFATRSFIDEFYNVFLKNKEKNPFSVEITNIPEDINKMIEAVSLTQTKAKVVPPTANVKSFSSVEDMLAFMSTASF